MSNDFKLGITGAIEPNITFLGGASKEVLRLSKDGIWANPDIPADDAAKLVLAAIDHNIKVMVDKAVNDKLDGAANYIDALGGDSKKYRQTLAQPEKEQEPVQKPAAVVSSCTGAGDKGVRVKWLGGFPQIGDRLYPAPPQHKPLTDDKLSDIWFKQSTDWMEFARAIEAAHGIKENT